MTSIHLYFTCVKKNRFLVIDDDPVTLESIRQEYKNETGDEQKYVMCMVLDPPSGPLIQLTNETDIQRVVGTNTKANPIQMTEGEC